jgi:hypothetical protein
MCVSPSRGALFERAAFFSTIAGAAAPFSTVEAVQAAEQLDGSIQLPPAPPNMSRGNARAAALAQRSRFVRTTYGFVENLARSIDDNALRQSVLDLLHDPTPQFSRAYPTEESRRALRDKFVAAGFIAANSPVEGIFPAGTMNRQNAPQPFWSTPGSVQDSHHAYPGGLAVHELFNSRMAVNFSQLYDRMYLSGRPASRDVAIGAALYHDIMKSIVFQWNDDGTLFKELEIGGTGGHHVLSGAEAIVRKRSPKFVIALLSAHAAPSLGDEDKVVTWLRAAAMLAGVDPVEYELLRRDGDAYKLAGYAPMEAFVNYLSDHDYVISVHAVHAVVPQLQRLAPSYGFDPKGPDYMWWRNGILSFSGCIGLYNVLARDGERSFDRTVARVAQRMHSV